MCCSTMSSIKRVRSVLIAIIALSAITLFVVLCLPTARNHYHAIVKQAALERRFNPIQWAKFVSVCQETLGYSRSDTIAKLVHKHPKYNMDHIRIRTFEGQSMTKEELRSEIQTSRPRDHHQHHAVPSAIHYVLLSYRTKFQFHNLVCVLSAIWNIRPKAVIFWYDEMPTGEYWDYLVRNTTQFPGKRVLIYRPAVESIYSIPVKVIEHKSDVMRLEALLEFGGIYLDTDIVVLRSLDALRSYQFTVGRETKSQLCNAVLLARPNATFLALWHTAYQLFRDENWGQHSVILPHWLASYWPDLVHIEAESLNRPNWRPDEIKWIYGPGRQWDWRQKNYCVHLWYRLHKKLYDFQSIKRVDSMMGDMFRYILYGNTNISAV